MMAKCEKREIPQPKHEYVLTLTDIEAAIVRELVLSVGGVGWVRAITNDIDAALSRANVAWPSPYHFDGKLLVKDQFRTEEAPDA